MPDPRRGERLLRPARPSDAAAIAATLREAFAEFEAWYTPLAFAATTPGPDLIAARELYIRSMAVHPAARGQGIGGQLLRAVEDFAIPNGYERLTLTTTPFLVAAIQLYQRAGFRRTGEPADLHGTPLFWMAKDLA